MPLAPRRSPPTRRMRISAPSKKPLLSTKFPKRETWYCRQIEPRLCAPLMLPWAVLVSRSRAAVGRATRGSAHRRQTRPVCLSRRSQLLAQAGLLAKRSEGRDVSDAQHGSGTGYRTHPRAPHSAMAGSPMCSCTLGREIATRSGKTPRKSLQTLAACHPKSLHVRLGPGTSVFHESPITNHESHAANRGPQNALRFGVVTRNSQSSRSTRKS